LAERLAHPYTYGVTLSFASHDLYGVTGERSALLTEPSESEQGGTQTTAERASGPITIGE